MAEPASRPLVLCADDYAITRPVSEGILALAEAGRLTATSVMTTRPHWPALAPALAALAVARSGTFSVGLHLNLTLGAPLAGHELARGTDLPPLRSLLGQALSQRLPEAALAREIDAQLDAFAREMGRAPDFIDGHQHVHVLPQVRRHLLAALHRRGLAGSIWVRDPSDGLAAILARPSAPKALLVARLAAGFGRAARDAGFATNAGFAGFTAFDPRADMNGIFAAFLRRAGARPLVMCHPGLDGDAELARLDPAVASRPREQAFLMTPRFAELCAANGLHLASRW